MARLTLPCACFALLAMLSASYQVTKVIDAKGDEAELSSMVRKEGATGSEAMAVNSEGEVSSMVRRHTDNEDPNQEELVDAPLQESPEDLKAALDEARARVKAAGEALKTAKEKVDATEEAKEEQMVNAREKFSEMMKAWKKVKALAETYWNAVKKGSKLREMVKAVKKAFKKASGGKGYNLTDFSSRQAFIKARGGKGSKKASRKAPKKANKKLKSTGDGTTDEDEDGDEDDTMMDETPGDQSTGDDTTEDDGDEDDTMMDETPGDESTGDDTTEDDEDDEDDMMKDATLGDESNANA